MTTVVQLNTRLNADLKRGGDAVFARFGLSPSEVVRKVWQYAVDTQSLPDFMERTTSDDALNRKLQLAREASGMAARLSGLNDAESERLRALCATSEREEERDDMYDAIIDEMEASHI